MISVRKSAAAVALLGLLFTQVIPAAAGEADDGLLQVASSPAVVGGGAAGYKSSQHERLSQSFPSSAPRPSLVSANDSIAGIDLDVTHISRTPRYDRFAVKQWPTAGEQVTFTAEVANKGSSASGSFSYQWSIDGAVVSSGSVATLGASSLTTLSFDWSWQAGAHLARFDVDSANVVAEAYENNNAIQDRTDALAVGFWVEQSVYQEFNSHVNGIGTYSWEDWAQSIITEMNWLFANSRYPNAPAGAMTRVRLDRITIVPDGTLFELNAQHAPIEGTTDVQWGFSVDEYRDCSFSGCYTTPWWVNHEMMHYLYGRIDLYAFDVQGGDVQVRDDDGHLIAGTDALPYIRWDVLHYTRPSYDLMAFVSERPIFSDYTVEGLNIAWPAGQRTSTIAWDAQFVQIPSAPNIRVLDDVGNPLANVSVSVYQAVWGDGTSGPYSQLFDNVADISGTTDSEGYFSLGAHPFGDLDRYGTPVGTLLVKLRNTASGEVGYVWLELTDFNLAYWRGSTGLDVQDVHFPAGPIRLNVHPQSVTFAAASGTNPPPQDVRVGFLGQGVAQWTVSASTEAWLRTIPSPDLSSQSYSPGSLTFIVDTAGLEEGTYSAEVTVSADRDVGQAPQNVTVNLTVGLPSLSVDDVSVNESAGNATFTVSLSGASGRSVTVDYATANNGASAPADYSATSGSLTFNPGQTSQTVSVPIIDDTLNEADETFNLNLSSPANATIADSQGTGTITDNDAPPSLSINDVTVNESAGTASFTVSLSAASGQSVTVDYATANNSANAPADYGAASGSLTFNPAETVKTVNVAIVDDSLDEPNETFNVHLSGPTNATIADSLGTGTIVDNDAPPRRPDGRIRKGRGAFVGNNIYNTTAVNQTKTGAAPRGRTITFAISIQNDATASDSFRLMVSGTASALYTVRYFHGTTDITAAIIAGTYTTPALGPGAKYKIKAKVTVMATATRASDVTRLVTITSLGDGTTQDTVGFIAKRR